MKKILAASAILLFCSMQLQAQNSGLFGGVGLGGNNVWVNHINPFWSNIPYNGKNISVSSGNRFVGSLGGDLGYAFTPHIALLTELNYAAGGSSYTDSTSAGITARVLKTTYTQIPLMLRLTSGSGGTGFFVEAGPHLAMMQTANMKETIPTGTSTYDIKNKFVDKEYGFHAALGLSIKANAHLSVDFGFKGVFGLTDINSPNIVYTNGYASHKSTTGSVGVRVAVHYYLSGW